MVDSVLEVQNIKLPDSGGVTSSTAITLDASGNVTLAGTGNDIGTVTSGTFNGTVGASATFPTRSDFGIIEIFAAGDPLIGTGSYQEFSYTSGQKYYVIVYIDFTDIDKRNTEVYRIDTDNTVDQIQTSTSNVTPSIPSSGTLRITTATVREVQWVKIIRMDW